MGAAVVRLIGQTRGVRLFAAVDRPGSARIGKDAGEVAGAAKAGVPVSEAMGTLPQRDVAIVDFTNPGASLRHLQLAARKKIPIVIGTTGFSAKQSARIKRLARRTPTLLAANMSVGVNLLLSLLGSVARTLGDDYDVEIIEAHHRYKKDAPSGTALALGRVVAAALKRDLGRVGVVGRKGLIGERKREEIGLMAVRAGDIVGEHTVIFGGLGERIEFIHRAHSRDTFARGAIRAAQWLVRQKKGLYDMRDVLALK